MSILPNAPGPGSPTKYIDWMQHLVRVLTPWMLNIEDTKFTQGEILKLKPHVVADLPPVTPAGCVIYVSDETGGAVVAFSDGTNWRRVTDRAVVS